VIAETSTWKHSKNTININAPVGFEPSISADEWPQTHAIARAANGPVLFLYVLKRSEFKLVSDKILHLGFEVRGAV